jgi:hypothetical protein
MTTPTDEAVERVAKAIFREDFPTGHKRGEWRKVSDAMRENYRAAARAAIAAIQSSVADALEAAADKLNQIANEFPVGHEQPSRGSSSFNWFTHCARTLRALAQGSPDDR